MSSCPITVAIPTYNRPAACRALVERLLPQLPSNAQILVIEQGASMTLPHDSRIRVSHRASPSLTRARNAAIDESAGELVLFLDDDCTPCPDIVPAHSSLHQEFPRHAVIFGKVHDRFNQGTRQRVIDIDLRTLAMTSDYGLDREEEVPCGPGGHCSIKRSVFAQVRFDPWFRGNAHFEEIDFAQRVSRRVGPLLFSSRAWIDHHMHEDGGCRAITTSVGFYFDRFYNRGLFFGKQCRLRDVNVFLRAQRNEIEYFSRRGKSHSLVQVGGAVAGLMTGFGAGLVRRRLGPSWYRY